MVTWRCPAAVRPRVTAAQNDFTVGAAAVALAVAAGRGERDGEGSGLADASDATAAGLAVTVAPGPVGTRPGPALHAPAVIASSRTIPATRERGTIHGVWRNMFPRS
jgi:hypothetical protein